MGAETHIAHAVATFSELGIATATVLLSDITNWRNSVKKGHEDLVGASDLIVQARKLGTLAYFMNKILLERAWRRVILYLLPYFAMVLGFIALIGISFYPKPWFESFSLLAMEREKLETMYWWLALSSFVASWTAAVIEKNGAKLADAADESRKLTVG